MKQLFILFSCSVIFAQTLFAQEKLDDAYLVCQYKSYYQMDTLQNKMAHDLWILQIGKNISKFYSHYTFQSDSLTATPEGKKQWQAIFDKALAEFTKDRDRKKFRNSVPSKRGTDCVYTNYPAGKVTVTDFIFPNQYVMYEDQMHNQDWQITDSIKTILGYHCQQAVCDFRGRRWTAWFTADIPTAIGPWKLGGLPGLIMEAYDKNDHYHFYIVGIEKKENLPIAWQEPFTKDRKLTKTTRKELLRAKMFSINYGGMEQTGPDLVRGKPKITERDLIERDYR